MGPKSKRASKPAGRGKKSSHQSPASQPLPPPRLLFTDEHVAHDAIDRELVEHLREFLATPRSARRRRARTAASASAASPATPPRPTIDDLGKLRKNPWRVGLRVRLLFPIGKRQTKEQKQRKRRRELLRRRKHPVVPPEDRVFESMTDFFDSHAGGVDELVESGDVETQILDDYVQQHIWKLGTFAVQSTWSEDRRERCRRGMTKDEIRKLRLLFGVRMMRDPTGR